MEIVDPGGEFSDTLYTIERPWSYCEAGGCGGEPFRSCVGPGTYRVTPFVRPNGDRVWGLSNPNLDAYPLDTDVPAAKKAWGRYLVLIHAANYARDVVGCMGRDWDGPVKDRGSDGHEIPGRREAVAQAVGWEAESGD